MVSLLYVGKKCWAGGKLVGVATSWGLIGRTGEHLKPYFLELDARPVEDRWMYIVFDSPLMIALSYMFVRFVLETPGMSLMKSSFGILNIVLAIMLLITGELTQDLFWHLQHCLIHFCAAVETGIIAHFLEKEKQRRLTDRML